MRGVFKGWSSSWVWCARIEKKSCPCSQISSNRISPGSPYPGVVNDNELSERSQRILARLSQPLTASQVAAREGVSRSACSRVLRNLMRCGLAQCLNPDARRSRVYGQTQQGRTFVGGEEPHRHDQIDWGRYGWICYSHRAAIIRVMDQPLQPATIKRKAKMQDATLRMSANNVRDVIRLFVEKGIAKPVKVKRRAHPRYELTTAGRRLQEQLLAAEARTSWAAGWAKCRARTRKAGSSNSQPGVNVGTIGERHDCPRHCADAQRDCGCARRL